MGGDPLLCRRLSLVGMLTGFLLLAAVLFQGSEEGATPHHLGAKVSVHLVRVQSASSSPIADFLNTPLAITSNIADSPRSGVPFAQRVVIHSEPHPGLFSEVPAGPYSRPPGIMKLAVPDSGGLEMKEPLAVLFRPVTLLLLLLLIGVLAGFCRLRAAVPPAAPAPADVQQTLLSLAGQSAGSTTAPEEEGRIFAEFLAWLTAHGATPNPPPVALRVGPDGLRGLYATRDLRPGEVILSVPQSLFLLESPADPEVGLPSLTMMALELLQKRRNPDWAPYLRALPPDCRTPSYHFSEAALAATEDPRAIDCALWNRDLASESIARLEGCLEVPTPPEDFLWALAILSSRSIEQPDVEGELRVLVPGVDMANHSFHPTAVIRWYHIGPEPQMQLVVVDPKGLCARQEVTIRYCNDPTQDYFLSYGFVPENNPSNFAVVFDGVEDLAESCQAVLSLWDPAATTQDVAQALTRSGVACDGLFVAPRGVDPRLLQALEGLCPSEDFVPAVTLHGCQRRLAQYSTDLAEDEAVLEAGGLDPDVAVAIQYRVAQKRILQGVVDLFHD